MGADKAVHLNDDALHGSDAVQTSSPRWPRRSSTLEYDLVITGAESTDARGGVMARAAGRAARPAQLTRPARSPSTARTVKIERQTDYGYDVVEGTHAGRGQRGGEDQRAALPVVQGDHGGQEEAADHDGARRRRHRRGRGRAGQRRRRSSSSPPRPPQAGGPDRQGRGRRRQQARRVPRRRRSSSDRPTGHARKGTVHMAEVLVLVEHVGGEPEEGHRRAADARPLARRAERGVRSARPRTVREGAGLPGRVRRGQGLRRRGRRSSTPTSSPRRPSVLAQLVGVSVAGRAC